MDPQGSIVDDNGLRFWIWCSPDVGQTSVWWRRGEMESCEIACDRYGPVALVLIGGCCVLYLKEADVESISGQICICVARSSHVRRHVWVLLCFTSQAQRGSVKTRSSKEVPAVGRLFHRQRQLTWLSLDQGNDARALNCICSQTLATSIQYWLVPLLAPEPQSWRLGQHTDMVKKAAATRYASQAKYRPVPLP